MSFKAGITFASLRCMSHKLATNFHVSSFPEPNQVNLDSGIIVEESEKGSKGDALNLFMSPLKTMIQTDALTFRDYFRQEDEEIKELRVREVCTAMESL
ncbi:unnamed protein product [Brassica napus]|uniref:(rape) hypothetical protein n=1 Tax=Brassica napus TaxID=3708 RepID=A0A816V3A5_BRANA|nr:unnamed protein product [Brassica napus]CAF2285391.1 unnamed protein product [Brassica napus]